MSNPSIFKQDIDINSTLDLLISVGEVTEKEIQSLRERLMPEFREFFEGQSEETKMTLSALYTRGPEELAELLDSEKSHMIGIHNIRCLLNVLLNIVPDLREKVSKTQ